LLARREQNTVPGEQMDDVITGREKRAADLFGLVDDLIPIFFGSFGLLEIWTRRRHCFFGIFDALDRLLIDDICNMASGPHSGSMNRRLPPCLAAWTPFG